MATITISKGEIKKVLGNLKDSEIDYKLNMAGLGVEKISENGVDVEITPNRPDLLSIQGLKRYLEAYFKKGGIKSFKVNPPAKDYKVKIEKSVKQVRPHTTCAIVRGIKFDDEKIKQVIDTQEKLHLTIGRKRQKIAIGIYPLEKIKLPIRYLAKKPDEIKFIPLESPNGKELTGAQILRQHPAGREYADLLKGNEVFPIFVDSSENGGKILSMPPIINSHETGKINERTKDVFIECSGSNLEHLKKCLNIIVTSLADMGGKIYSVEISDPVEGKSISPDLTPERLEFKIKDINKILGLELTEKDIKRYLEKMGIGFEKSKDKTSALVPAYRADILHWIDISEEIAIAYGYDNFEAEIPKIATIGKEDKNSAIKRTVGSILTGLGLLEVSSYHLTSKQDIKKMHYNIRNEDLIEVEDSKTEFNLLRIDLLTNLLKIFSENSNSSYPQKIFELGTIFFPNPEKETGIEEKQILAIALSDEKTNFTELKQILDYLFKMLDKEYEIRDIGDEENNNFILGRAGEIIVDKKPVGLIGEISPRVLKNWKVKMPVSALEINIGCLFD